MSTENNNTRNIDPEKVTAERLNGYAALFGCIALIGAYATTGQIIPGFVWSETISKNCQTIELTFAIIHLFEVVIDNAIFGWSFRKCTILL